MLKQNDIKKRKGGYSLVEMLVYAAIFSLLSITVIRSLIVMTRSFSETVVIRDYMNTSFVVERMSRDIRNSSTIDASSTFDSSPGYLKLNTTDAGGAQKTVEFTLSGTNIELKENGAVTGNLNVSNMQVTSLIFRQISTPQGKAVKIEMSVKNTRDRAGRTENFYNTVGLRGEYAN